MNTKWTYRGRTFITLRYLTKWMTIVPLRDATKFLGASRCCRSFRCWAVRSCFCSKTSNQSSGLSLFLKRNPSTKQISTSTKHRRLPWNFTTFVVKNSFYQALFSRNLQLGSQWHCETSNWWDQVWSLWTRLLWRKCHHVIGSAKTRRDWDKQHALQTCLLDPFRT